MKLRILLLVPVFLIASCSSNKIEHKIVAPNGSSCPSLGIPQNTSVINFNSDNNSIYIPLKKLRKDYLYTIYYTALSSSGELKNFKQKALAPDGKAELPKNTFGRDTQVSKLAFFVVSENNNSQSSECCIYADNRATPRSGSQCSDKAIDDYIFNKTAGDTKIIDPYVIGVEKDNSNLMTGKNIGIGLAVIGAVVYIISKSGDSPKSASGTSN